MNKKIIENVGLFKLYLLVTKTAQYFMQTAKQPAVFLAPTWLQGLA